MIRKTLHEFSVKGESFDLVIRKAMSMATDWVNSRYEYNDRPSEYKLLLVSSSVEYEYWGEGWMLPEYLFEISARASQEE